MAFKRSAVRSRLAPLAISYKSKNNNNLNISKMFAIVDIKGKQYKVTENDRIYINRIKDDVGAKVSFGDVLMFSKDEKSFQVGAPKLSMNVEATVLGHIKDDKVIIFKKKRRKGYKRTKGHRQQYTEIEINSIK
jgi:large subunit ribosomal protein L21